MDAIYSLKSQAFASEGSCELVGTDVTFKGEMWVNDEKLAALGDLELTVDFYLTAAKEFGDSDKPSIDVVHDPQGREGQLHADSAG